MELSSVFQPIYGMAHQRVIGYEALIRARTPEGLPVPPPELFELPYDVQELVELDRLCRLLHVANFRELEPRSDTWLFLNVEPRVVVDGPGYGSFFQELLEHFTLPPHRVVMEVLEGQIPDEDKLSRTAQYYRSVGCLVAVDDFGTGYSNFDRVIRLSPDIVKLDRSMAQQAMAHSTANRILPSLVSLLHEAGCLVLLEGVERRDDGLMALETDADFVQGYLFGRPSASPNNAGESDLKQLTQEYLRSCERRSHIDKKRLSPYLTALQRTAHTFQQQRDLATAASHLMDTTNVIRCYQLDAEGRQYGSNIVNPRRAALADPRFLPLSNTEGAVWHRRGYFHTALANREQIQISRPYLSVTGAELCITLSIALEVDGEVAVLCCDIDANAI